MRERTALLTDHAPTQRGFGAAARSGAAGSTRVPLPPSRYEIRDLLGEGGMGEVLAAYDEQIGRDVALKRMRDGNPAQEAIERFVREARIQGRLDHPAIVPVHELATDGAGLPYFTMQRILGKTLARRVADGAPLHELLRGFVDVCRAIDFAHSRGVVHRDLKPANVMLGDFGEVYVLDWGIARVLDEPELAPEQPRTLDSFDDTKTGALMGTLGYMAPELYRGVLATPASDCYALGAILFELLAGEALHTRQHPALAAVVEGIREFPSKRRPERSVPPELDRLAFAALSPLAHERPSARDLADQVQAYLDGDRDLEHRRQLAAEQLRTAQDALSGGGPESRVLALRRASRALALDPESSDAATLVTSLLLASPDPLPAALTARLDAQERRDHRDRSRRALAAYFALSVLLPMLVLLEVQDWTWVAAVVATITLAMGASLFHLWRGRPSIPLVAVSSLGVVVAFSRIASPFVLTPLLVTCALVAITTIPWFTRNTWAVIGWTLAAVLLPHALEWSHLLERTWQITDRGMLITGDVFATHGRTDEIALVVASVVCTLIGGLLALGVSRRQQTAQRKLYIQAWHLGYLVPRADTHADVR